MSGIAPNYTFHNAGIFVVTLNVSDGGGNCGLDPLIVTVRDTTSPLANAGGNSTNVNWGEQVVLNGSDSQDNVGIVNYTWSFVYNDTLCYLYGEEVCFRFFSLGNFTVNLNVTDAEGNTGEDSCTIEVVDKIPPLTDAGADMLVGVGDTVTLDANGTTDHSEIISYIWMFTYNATTETLNGSRVNFTFDLIGTYSILLIVRDEWENTATDTLTIEVRDATSPVADAGADREILEGNTAHFYGGGSDNVGIMNYNWKFIYNNSEVILEGKVASFVFEIAGNYSVTLTVADEAGNTGEEVFWVNVSALPDGDDDTDDDNNDDNDENDDLTENGDNQTGETGSFLTSIPGLLGIGALLVLLIIVLVIATRKKRRDKEPMADMDDEEEDTAGDVAELEGEGKEKNGEEADIGDEAITDMDATSRNETTTDSDAVDDEIDITEDVEKADEDGVEDNSDITVADDEANELSEDDLDLEGIGGDLICISCGKKVSSSDSNCPQCGEELEVDL